MRTYKRNESVVFCKTKDEFGGLSNMSGGYPICVNSHPIRTSEALYQACRYPHLPEVQRLIIEQKSPMTAKMKSKLYRAQTRPDWESIRIPLMRWCIEVKLLCNWDQFSNLLISTGCLPIVEESKRDDFWGAKIADNETLIGVNALGRLLMDIRGKLDQYIKDGGKLILHPPQISNFLLFDYPIGTAELEIKDKVPGGSNVEHCLIDYPSSLLDFIKNS